ncbi:hypothetical protein [Amphritea sp.]|uniref:hypothetical protein n=1 Tax=Amphritea sp. TaxID=1872502 RepID=UPI0025C221E2|nr:hypothetical protein [Amphritea sp.]
MEVKNNSVFVRLAEALPVSDNIFPDSHKAHDHSPALFGYGTRALLPQHHRY